MKRVILFLALFFVPVIAFTQGVDPKMIWNRSTGTSGLQILYRIQIDTTTAFASPYMDSSAVIDTFYNTPKVLRYLATYYWHVMAYYAMYPAVTSAWSATWNFTTAGPPAPTVPVLIFPANGAQNISMNFQWNSAPNNGYTLQVAIDPNFNYLLADVSGIADTCYSINIPSCTLCFARVKGTGDWSTVVWFKS